jgi:hypothetical protein
MLKSILSRLFADKYVAKGPPPVSTAFDTLHSPRPQAVPKIMSVAQFDAMIASAPRADRHPKVQCAGVNNALVILNDLTAPPKQAQPTAEFETERWLYTSPRRPGWKVFLSQPKNRPHSFVVHSASGNSFLLGASVPLVGAWHENEKRLEAKTGGRHTAGARGYEDSFLLESAAAEEADTVGSDTVEAG